MSGVVPMMGTPFASRSRASFKGVCPPNWTITPEGFFLVYDLEDVLKRKRFEIKAVGSIVVGRDRFGLQLTMIVSNPSSRSASAA